VKIFHVDQVQQQAVYV